MDLGNFSISLAVKDLEASKRFYEKLGFDAFMGDAAQNWLILKNGDHVIGLFQGMFEKNILTFNPGWDANAQTLGDFTDVRELQRQLQDPGCRVRDDRRREHDRPGQLHRRGPGREPDPRRPARLKIRPMRAALRDRYGPPEVVALRDVERPTATGDQVLVRVHAASVNRADLDGLDPRPAFVRLFIGSARAAESRASASTSRASSRPWVPEVTRFQPGDRVFGDMYAFRAGSFAEYVCAPERAFATMPTACRSRKRRRCRIRPSSRVQGLRRRNGRTVGAGRQGPDRRRVGQRRPIRGPDREIARRRGDRRLQHRRRWTSFARSAPTTCIDYTTIDYTKTGERYDWILDTDSHHSIMRVRRALDRTACT